MRIGLVGVGRIGALHAATLKGLGTVEQVVVADADPARAQAVAKELGLEAAPDVDALLGAGLDAVAICAPTSAHAELIARAQDAGLTTFCEKPLAADLPGTRQIAERVAGGDVPVHIGFQRRFDAGFRAAHDAVTSGSLGWIHTIRANTSDAARGMTGGTSSSRTPSWPGPLPTEITGRGPTSAPASSTCSPSHGTSDERRRPLVVLAGGSWFGHILFSTSLGHRHRPGAVPRFQR